MSTLSMACTRPARRAMSNHLGWFDRIILLGLGVICLNDYISSIWEIRLARNDFPTVWTLRIGEVPVADLFVIVCLLFSAAKSLTKSARSNFESRPMDWYMG